MDFLGCGIPDGCSPPEMRPLEFAFGKFLPPRWSGNVRKKNGSTVFNAADVRL